MLTYCIQIYFPEIKPATEIINSIDLGHSPTEDATTTAVITSAATTQRLSTTKGTTTVAEITSEVHTHRLSTVKDMTTVADITSEAHTHRSSTAKDMTTVADITSEAHTHRSSTAKDMTTVADTTSEAHTHRSSTIEDINLTTMSEVTSGTQAVSLITDGTNLEQTTASSTTSATRTQRLSTIQDTTTSLAAETQSLPPTNDRTTTLDVTAQTQLMFSPTKGKTTTPNIISLTTDAALTESLSTSHAIKSTTIMNQILDELAKLTTVYTESTTSNPILTTQRSSESPQNPSNLKPKMISFVDVEPVKPGEPYIDTHEHEYIDTHEHEHADNTKGSLDEHYHRILYLLRLIYATDKEFGKETKHLEDIYTAMKEGYIADLNTFEYNVLNDLQIRHLLRLLYAAVGEYLEESRGFFFPLELRK